MTPRQLPMRPALKSLLFLVLAALLSVACLAQEGAKTLPLWEVRSATGTVYLFGTIHVGRSEFYPLPEAIERAYSASKSVALELDPTDTNALSSALQLAMYQAPDNLENHLSEALRENLQRALSRYGVSFEQIRQMKPFMVMLTLTSLEYVRLGYDPTTGLDQYFAVRARRDAKRIVQLESAAIQLAMMNNLSAALQRELLRVTLDEIGREEVPALIEAMVAAWKQGNVARLSAILFEEERRLPPALANEFHENFLTRRNQDMRDNIEHMLSGGETHFVAVGAGHLLGDDGLVALLSKKGYEVIRR